MAKRRRFNTSDSHASRSPAPLRVSCARVRVCFPLFGIVDGACACGNAKCSRVGKHPHVAWGELKLGDAVPRPAPGAGYGIKTGAAPKGSGVFVIDVDSFEAALAANALG